MSEKSKDRECRMAQRCLNYKREGVGICTTCSKEIDGDHFHDLEKKFRLCVSCFNGLLRNKMGEYLELRPPIKITPKVCVNYDDCEQVNFKNFRPKKCDACKRYPIDQHYHDVAKNIRLCVRCYVEQKLRPANYEGRE